MSLNCKQQIVIDHPIKVSIISCHFRRVSAHLIKKLAHSWELPWCVLIPGRGSQWEPSAGAGGAEGAWAEVKAGHSGLKFTKTDSQNKAGTTSWRPWSHFLWHKLDNKSNHHEILMRIKKILIKDSKRGNRGLVYF